MTMYHITDDTPIACDRGVLCKSGAHYTSLTAASAALITPAAATIAATTAAPAPKHHVAETIGTGIGEVIGGIGEVAGWALGAVGDIIDIVNIFD